MPELCVVWALRGQGGALLGPIPGRSPDLLVVLREVSSVGFDNNVLLMLLMLYFLLIFVSSFKSFMEAIKICVDMNRKKYEL